MKVIKKENSLGKLKDKKIIDKIVEFLQKPSRIDTRSLAEYVN